MRALSIFILTVSAIFAISCCHRGGEKSTGECYIEDVLVSNMRMSGDLFMCDVEAILHTTPEAQFYSLDKSDMKFHSTGPFNPSTVLFEIKDRNGFVFGSASVDGPITKKEISFMYKILPVEENDIRLFATLMINGKTVSKISKPINLSQERLSSPEVQP